MFASRFLETEERFRCPAPAEGVGVIPFAAAVTAVCAHAAASVTLTCLASFFFLLGPLRSGTLGLSANGKPQNRGADWPRSAARARPPVTTQSRDVPFILKGVERMIGGGTKLKSQTNVIYIYSIYIYIIYIYIEYIYIYSI